MEKPRINFSVSHILFLLRGIVGRTMNANTLWRSIIGSVFAATIGICIFAYFIYSWANSTELPQVLTKKDRDVFSPEDLKKAITLYQEKEERYNGLLSNRPIAPLYVKGKGVSASSPEVSQENIVASGTPSLAPQGRGTSTLP